MTTRVKVRVLYFAGLRERAGTSQSEEEASAGTTVGDLWERIRERPEIREHRLQPGFAVNGEWCLATRVLADGDEVGLLPPVSGG